MDAALGWIGEIARWFAAWIPRLVIIDKRCRAIKFVRGANVKEHGPGLMFYWPLLTTCEVHPVVQQTLRLDTQSLDTRDGIQIEAQCLVTYTVADLTLLMTEVWDHDTWMSDICLGAARQVVCTTTLGELERDHIETDRRLASEIRKLVHRYGVRIQRGRFVSLVPVFAMKHFGCGQIQDTRVDANE